MPVMSFIKQTIDLFIQKLDYLVLIIWKMFLLSENWYVYFVIVGPHAYRSQLSILLLISP